VPPNPSIVLKNPAFYVIFSQVCLQSIAVTMPSEVVTSDEIESRLQPLYSRLRLPSGRLELMSGIASRRVWPVATVPSGPSIASGNAAIDASGIDRAKIGCLIHASVCRDFLEPATASKVHHGLGLSEDCWVYDVSNACLGLLNGAVQIASLIEAGVIQAGVVVGTENSRPLMQRTIEVLNADLSLTRQSVKPAFASLTIGSGSCAWLLAHRDLAGRGEVKHAGSPFLAAVAAARTEFHDLCRSDDDTAGAAMQPVMDTDSEKLLHEGIATGAAAFAKFLPQTGWDRSQIDRTICHQVGGKHRQLMLETLGLRVENDHMTFPWTGNTGSVALPITLADAAHRGFIQPGQRVALMGIGSGINSVMAAVQWGQTGIVGNFPDV
jgi:acyl-CoA:acyl-CoA alkyltransferase